MSSGVYKHMSGKDNHNWKGGKPHCCACGKLLTNYGRKRCKKCYKKYNKGKNNSNWKGGKPKCIDCGKQLAGSAAKRCPKCFHKHNMGQNNPMYGTHKLGKDSPSWKGGLPNCCDCGKKLSIRTGKRCLKCANKFKSGKNNASWKGGITPIEVQIRNSPEYKQWRDTIFKRDKFTCIDCEQVGGKLEAHHIKFFSDLLQEAIEMFPDLPVYDAAMLYAPLWDTNNGITYCKKHHKEFHKQYARANKETESRKANK
jgi:hypothetical protein